MLRFHRLAVSTAPSSVRSLHHLGFRPHPPSLSPFRLPSSSLQTFRPIRNYSTGLPPKKTPVWRKAIIYCTLSVGAITGVVALLLSAAFAYDASTYSTESFKTVEVPSLALSPVRGGPKNLPICYSHLDDNDTAVKQACKADKPRLVVLGSGWGSVSLLKELDSSQYNITVISPSNYFLYTPMLPSATVGTLEFRSLVEPIRRVLRRIDGHFLEGRAADVNFDEKLVEVHTTSPDTGETIAFYVPYDKLVIGVGSTTNPHGVPGLEYCHFLKTVQDARDIRNRIVSNIEMACLPTTSEERRKALLSFVVCGGGPTGVELASEIQDMLNEDLFKYYPKLVRSNASVHIIQSRSHILNTYDQSISDYAEQRFAQDEIDVQVNSRVQEVKEDSVVFSQTLEDGTKVIKEIPHGLCVWSTGVSQAPLTQEIVGKLKEYQHNRHAIETDSYLRVIGLEGKDVYAVGDCATVRTSIAADAQKMVKNAILHKRSKSKADPTEEELANTRITYNEWVELAGWISYKHPQSSEHFRRLHELFEDFDKDHSGTLSISELTEVLKYVDRRITSLPATAQRAHQQGTYLAKKLNRMAVFSPSDLDKLKNKEDDGLDAAIGHPFVYRHLGSLAYVSNAAVFDFNGTSFFGGLVAMYLWRGIYFAQTVSTRQRVLLAFDWMKRGFFGRDMSDITQDTKQDITTRTD